MAAFGARLDVIDSPQGIHPDLVPMMMRRVAEIVAEEGEYATVQFRNCDALDGYRRIGHEIVAQIDAPIATFCAYVGVGGCFLGVGDVLSTHHPEIWKRSAPTMRLRWLGGRRSPKGVWSGFTLPGGTWCGSAYINRAVCSGGFVRLLRAT